MQVIQAFAIGRIIRSKNSNFKEGDLVTNPFSPIAEYCVAPPHLLKRIDPTAGIPLPDYISALGIIIFLSRTTFNVNKLFIKKIIKLNDTDALTKC